MTALNLFCKYTSFFFPYLQVLKAKKTAHSLAGGEKDVAVYLVANENAIPFYEKLGMRKADDVMEYNHIEWTEFTVK